MSPSPAPELPPAPGRLDAPRRPFRVWRWLVGALVLVLALANAWLGYVAWQFSSFLLYPKPFAHPDDPARYGLKPEAVAIRSPRLDLPLKGWFFQNPAAHGRAVLFLHGWRSHRQHMLKPYLSWLARGYSVLAFDHPGCGESPAGIATLGAGERDDAEAALRLLESRGYTRLAVFGVSMGGTTAIDLAAGHPEIRAVVSEATYARPVELTQPFLIRKGFPFPYLVGEAVIAVASARAGRDIASAAAIDAVPRLAGRPLFLVHGTADHVIAPENAQWLFDAAPGPKQLWWVPGADHISEDAKSPPAVAGAAYAQRVRAFLDQAL
jgi:pimeloyl-ACP methyl ester carboxylesterase